MPTDVPALLAALLLLLLLLLLGLIPDVVVLEPDPVPELPAELTPVTVAGVPVTVPVAAPAPVPVAVLPLVLLPLLVPGVVAVTPVAPVLVRVEPVLIAAPLCGSDAVIWPRISPSGKAVECTLK